MSKNKQKKLSIFLAILLVVALAQMACRRSNNINQDQGDPTSSGAPSRPAGGNSVILFEDDFQQGLSSAWRINTAWDVQQTGDVYLFHADGEGGAWIPGGYAWTQYVFRANGRVDSGSLLFSFDLTQQGRYILLVNQDGLMLVKDYPVGEYTVLAETGPIPTSGWHYFAMGNDNGRIQAYVDGDLWINYLDPSPLTSGTVGVSAMEGSSVSVDNVLVNQLTISLVSGPTVAPPPVASGSQPVAELESQPEIIVQDVEPSDEPIEPQEENQDDGEESWLPAEITFTVEDQDSATIDAGQCVSTSWTVENAQEVYYNDFLVGLSGFEDECPETTTTYTLTALGTDMEYVTAQVTVTVNTGGEDQDDDGSDGGGDLPDLRVRGTGVDPASPFVGDVVNVVVNVINRGGATASAFTVQWYPEGSGSFVGCSWDMNGLDAGVEYQLQCFYPGYPSAGDFNWYSVVDPENEIEESDDTNNDRSSGITIQQAIEDLPREPVNCSATTFGPTSLRISWASWNNDTQDGFRIYQAETSLEVELGPDETGYTFTTLEPNTEYHFDVRAFNAAGETAVNACEVYVTTPAE